MSYITKKGEWTINKMISIVSQVNEDMKKKKEMKMQVVNFISHGLSSRHANKKDNKGKPKHEKKKIEMKEQWNKPKKVFSKRNCKFYKKV